MRKKSLTYSEAAARLGQIGFERGDWSGLPMPVEGLELVLEPRYPYQELAEIKFESSLPDVPSELTYVNSWFSRQLGITILIVKNKEGRVRPLIRPDTRLAFLANTLSASVVWPLEAECKAVLKLGKLIPPHLIQMYAVCGHFTETSKRSGVTYMFRRGRPTLALRAVTDTTCLCGLCLHPIGYYRDTWAGVMCPTDEVIAHLLMMRGCEEKYWANANQHSVDDPRCGV